MKKDRDYIMFLEDIFDSAKNIEKYTKGLSKKKFFLDEQTIDAVVRRFEIIGEATKHVPIKIKRKYPKIAWKKMAGMRDILIHEYFGVNKDKLWKTTKEDVPDLKDKMSKILKEIKAQSLI